MKLKKRLIGAGLTLAAAVLLTACRTETTLDHCSSPAQGCTSLDFGRSNILSRYSYGGVDSKGYGPFDGGTHILCHRPSLVNHPQC